MRLTVVSAAFLAMVMAVPAVAQAETKEPTTVQLETWLLAGPMAVPLPAFHDAEKHGFGVQDLLEEESLNLTNLVPREGETPLPGMTWRARTVKEATPLEAVGPDSQTDPHRAYLATYLTASRFVQVKVEVKSEHPVKIYVDGAAVKAGEEFSLLQGKHQLLVATVHDPEKDAPWRLEPRLTLVKPADGPAGIVTASTSPERFLQIEDFVDADWVEGITVNPDGDRVAIHLRHPSAPADFAEQWTEIRSLEPGSEGTLLHTLRCGRDGFTWAPSGHRYSYRESGKEGKSSLWIADLDGGEPKRLLHDIEGLGEVRWLPDSLSRGASLLYTVTAEEKDHADDIKRYHGLTDRWSYGRNRDHLYQVWVADGTRRRLTAGEPGVTLEDVHPSGTRLLISRNLRDDADFPFDRGELAELDLNTLEARILTRQPWFQSASYGPSADDGRVLVLGSPQMFEGAGQNVPEGMIPNLYDYQAFLLDPQTGAAEPLTRDFDPSILDAQWTADGILFEVQVGSRVEVVRLDPAAGAFTTVVGGGSAGVDVVQSFSADRQGGVIAYYGFSPDVPQQVLARRGDTAPTRLDEPFDDTLAGVRIGEVKEWNFTNEAGRTIQGRIHYPPDFDPGKRYPLILQYYGGTVPTDRSFGGRYPHTYWAGLGYVVYVPQPSGATGYGQEFSALHVNNWGKTNARDIIEGTRKLLAEAPYLDSEKVGCFGSSYGGFMTMYLLVNSDLCSAGISHAGISSISSYWGEGWWGYSYSAAATSGSYPWNRPDLYIDQSPLFRADHIQAPLLLLHGEDDTNVPIGESQQFYTALRILNKDVEFLTFADENHRIVAYDRHKWWLKAVQAWFDRHLKGEPEMWEVLFGGR